MTSTILAASQDRQRRPRRRAVIPPTAIELDGLPWPARYVGRLFGLPPSTARVIAEAAGFAMGDGR